VSNAPFDAGHDRHWHAIDTYFCSGPVNQPQFTVATLDLTDFAVIRVDAATVILEYAVSDGTASGQLMIQHLAFGLETLFLTAAADPETYLVGSTPTASPYGQERICAQLAHPFYVTTSAAIYLSGHGTSGSASNVYATVSLSGSYSN
jgi:hypothetical protein